MALPKLTVPTYETILPVTKAAVSFRPFLVKEEKLLLIAMQSKDSDTITKTIIQILKNCALTKLDVENLPLVDAEYLFLQLRARSVGEGIEVNYKCTKIINEELQTRCDVVSPYSVDLLTIQAKFSDGHQQVIALTDTIGVTMRYPTMGVVGRFDFKNLSPKDLFDFMGSNIESIYDADRVYPSKEISKPELSEFLDSLNSAQSKQLQAFFETLPQLSATIAFHCPTCQHQELVEVKGLQNFFA